MSNRVSEYMKQHRLLQMERKSMHPREHALKLADFEKTKLWEQMTTEERKLVWQLEETAT